MPNERALALARRLSASKAAGGALERPDAIVLGADTIVVARGRALGKPRDAEDAVRMLRALRGRTHSVVTAICVQDPAGGQLLDSVTTRVQMRPYGDDEIAAYVRSGDPFDKAGAYAIQHAGFQPVATFVGCYSNVVGLPLCLVADFLERVGLRQRWETPGGCQHRLHAPPQWT
jgi:MAF protein